MFWTLFVILALGAALLTAAAIAPLRAWLLRRAILDLPNDRSSHTVPTPRGGGLAVVASILAGGIVAIAATGHGYARDLDGLLMNGPLILLLMAALTLLSWIDDRGSLPAGLRLLAQGLACAAGLLALPSGGIFQGLLPGWADLALAWFAWLWFVNLYNFMDGIDGITAVETVTIAGGAVLMAALGATLLGPVILAGPFLTEGPRLLLILAVVAGAACGFLWWNRPPARIFLGDAGSVPLGFLLGWVLLLLAANGHWAAALILPLYHLADASLTLGLRLLRGERIWQAHRQHFYQQAARQFGGHGRVLARLVPLNLALVLLAGLTVAWPALSLPALAGAAAMVAATFWHFQERRPGAAISGGSES
ncbi:glycosyl transferase [Marinibaculum pumilum]|uniref:Glycosyl transferase n=1 Tax=Marinibaculum pumilum TaxID=1766165 RepID=A0ABV7KYI5_9PROT